ncbi:MAG: TRAP transporter large permease subunit, partial [Pseudomonadota bacterium]
MTAGLIDVAPDAPAEQRLRAVLAFGIGVAASVMHFYFNIVGTLPMLTMTTWHFALIGALGLIALPAFTARTDAGRRTALLIDLTLALLVVSASIYIWAAEDTVARRGYDLFLNDWIAAVVVIVLGLERTRRTTGWVMPILATVAFTYVTLWGPWIDGTFFFVGLPWESAVRRSIYTDEGMFGIIANISVRVVALFILLGAFLEVSGAAQAVIDVARALVGRITGGPGFVAVTASGMMGTISGSAAANTAGTGCITIPLMKKAGFKPKFAAGVEAAASTGGQLTPPIMGAGVFVMASITGVPYVDLIAVAALPALLYFLSVAFWIRIEAKKHGVGAGDSDAPPIM